MRKEIDEVILIVNDVENMPKSFVHTVMNGNFVVNDIKVKVIKQKIKNNNKTAGYIVGVHIAIPNDVELSKHMFLGWSMCDKNYDIFDKAMGTKIAIVRALKIANSVRNNNYEECIGPNKHTLANSQAPMSISSLLDRVEARCANYLGNVGSIYSYCGQWIHATSATAINMARRVK